MSKFKDILVKPGDEGYEPLSPNAEEIESIKVQIQGKREELKKIQEEQARRVERAEQELKKIQEELKKRQDEIQNKISVLKEELERRKEEERQRLKAGDKSADTSEKAASEKAASSTDAAVAAQAKIDALKARVAAAADSDTPPPRWVASRNFVKGVPVGRGLADPPKSSTEFASRGGRRSKKRISRSYKKKSRKLRRIRKTRSYKKNSKKLRRTRRRRR
jgi:hypothetical protein